MAFKLVDKVLGIIGFDEVSEDEEQDRVDDMRDEQPWHKKREKEKGNVINLHPQRQVRVVVIEPRTFEDVKEISDHLLSRCPVIVNLELAEPELAKRIIDFVSGSTYALNGHQQKVGNGIFLFAPQNIDISSELKNQKEKGIFPWMRS
ncbi:MAG: Cell division protein SepF [Pelotomaculum sp. PtaB.Bin104]|nr:MAG: Cell division protein SepF [Pelotomaculum sp. PtaB.Bin104]